LNGHHYKSFAGVLSWSEAKSQCERMGGHLVTITTRAENDIVTKASEQRHRFWIGLYRENTAFKWVTGEPFGYKKWGPGPHSSEGEFAFSTGGQAKFRRWVGTWVAVGKPDKTDLISGYACEWEY
jgi:hypothetical protein